MLLKLKRSAFLAFGMAFLLDACSSDNPAGTSSGSSGAGTGNANAGEASKALTKRGGVDPIGEGSQAEKALTRANTLREVAEKAVARATLAAATAETGTKADRDAARRLIGEARNAIDAAVEAANAAVTASADGSAADIGAAARAANKANALRTERTTVLDNALASLGWFRRSLARYELKNGEAMMPPAGGDGITVRIKRIPRTIPTSSTDSTPKANPDAFTSTTFKDVMYADGKEVFSVADDAEGGDEFRVNGYAANDDVSLALQEHTFAGLKVTDDGIVIRTGGTPPESLQLPGEFFTDFTDMRRDITKLVNDGGPPHGENGWDLEITFREPHIVPVAGGSVSSWTGNSVFYWKSIVPADPSQLETDEDHYVSGAFSQPDRFKDLGTYEVWLSNYLGVLNRGLEPVASSGVVRCPDGSRGTSCPFDDTHQYSKYAAYGLFVYAADRATFRSGNTGQKGRVQTLHFGYSAFGSEDGEATTDIGTAITSATFNGQTLAYAFTGNTLFSENRDSKLLRGDAAFTVTIPKSGAGTIEGDLENFEEWTGSRWRPLTSGLSVDLQRTDISDSGAFSGTATPSSTVRSADFPSTVLPGDPNYPMSGGIARLGATSRQYQGSFYGPRGNSADLEIAGSWQLSTVGNVLQWEVYGSFGAKQKPAATP